ncbi:unnamed protein product [Leptosia nina]|uniref:Uncharacterized protein n=1 Tax=Leptosia nina TaxID=320188 RepID=A0AAV1J465_9NEOP
MFRLSIYIFVLLVSAECGYHHSSKTGYQFKNNIGFQKLTKENCCPEDDTQKVSVNLKAANLLLKKFCNGKYNTREVYDEEVYRIKIKLKRHIEDLIQVKINYRVIYVILKLQDGYEIIDARILPQGLQTRNAVWKLDSDELIVSLPYKNERNLEVQLDCGGETQYPKSVVNVPLGVEYSIATDYRYGY